MRDKPSLLVIDDEESICFAFQRYFGKRGYSVTVAASGREGLEAHRRCRPDVVFLDVRLPDRDGLEVLRDLRQRDPAARVVVITAYGSLETVTRAVRDQAFDYLVKPLDLDRAAQVVAQALAAQATAAANGTPAAPRAAEGLTVVGASAVMQEVYKRLGRAAAADTAVLITGSTGTGKELVARAIHEHGSRRDRPFVAVNCGTLPEHLVESELFGFVRGAFTGAEADKPGRVEMADTGTLFLDEVGDLPLAAQVKLLRFLDVRAVERLGAVYSIPLDVRVLAATNRDLGQMVREGRFRPDLYYRLAVVHIDLPPLADRRDDILPLARHFLADWAARRGQGVPPLDEAAAAVLLAYDWPGNVRELRNAVEHAVVASGGGPILPTHLPSPVLAGRGHGLPAAATDPESLLQAYVAAIDRGGSGLYRAATVPLVRELLRRALAEAGGNQVAAARRLGLHRNTLRRMLRHLAGDSGPAPS